jgi:hypothetical protein
MLGKALARSAEKGNLRRRPRLSVLKLLPETHYHVSRLDALK